MSRITKTFVSGAVGNVIYYEFNGKPFARRKPLRVRQNKATRRASKEFGQIKTLSRQIRSGLAPLFFNPRERALMYRVDRAVGTWFRKDKQPAGRVEFPLEGMEFFDGSALKRRMKAAVSVNWSLKGKVALTLSALDPIRAISAPKGTVEVQLVVAVATCSTIQLLEESADHMHTIPYKAGIQDAVTIELPYQRQRGALTVVGVALHYRVKEKGELRVIEDEKWRVAELVEAWFDVSRR